MKTSSFIIIASLLICALYAQEKSFPPGDRVIRRTGEPDCYRVMDDNKPMADAVQKARKTMNKFISALRSPNNNQSRFAVKKPFMTKSNISGLTKSALTGKCFTEKLITNRWTSKQCISATPSR